jgi:hypothetical protein
MLSLFWMVVKWAVISPYDEQVRKLVTSWRACTKIGFSLVEQARKLVTRWLIMREKLVSRWLSICENPFWRTSYVLFFTSLYLFSCPMSPVLRLCSLSPVLCLLPYVSVLCLLSSVPCLTWSAPCLPSSFLCELTSINCPSVLFTVALFHCSCRLFFYFPSSFPPSLVLCLSLVVHTCENASSPAFQEDWNHWRDLEALLVDTLLKL